MKTPLFLAACALLGLAAWAAGLRFMDEVEPGWWPMAVTLVGGATILGRLWVARAASQSPMRFVSSVNGASAIKMFSMLILITTYLVMNEGGRVPFALGTFAVFVAFLVLFVVDLVILTGKNKKKSP